ncbi:MAG TPA: hypothetical protein PKJ91_07035 [Methanoregulaceae archaeon]|nr:hypothetical protein [Methanoregulaceae archaeon]
MGVEPCIAIGIIASMITLKVIMMTKILLEVHTKLVLSMNFHLNFGWAAVMGIWRVPHSM